MMNGNALLQKFSLKDGVKRYRISETERKRYEIVYEDTKEFEELICSIFLMDKYYPSENKLKFGTANIMRLKTIIKDLEDLFNFCTGRRLSITLIPIGKTSTLQQRMFSNYSVKQNGALCLFSGGLDSACGALKLKKSGELPLLSHTATGNIVLGQVRRVGQHPRLRDLPIIVSDMRLTRFTDADSSQVSTRGLLFLSNALTLASSFGKDRVFFAENGPLMINPSVSALSVSTRNAHPYVIKTIEQIFNHLSDSKIEINSMFKNNTKAEIIAEAKLDNIIDKTWSCFKVQGQSRMCGLCYACLVRRLSAFAAGYSEPSTAYKMDSFLVKRKDLSQTSREDLDILRDTFLYLKKIVDNDVIDDEVNYYIPNSFFDNVSDLLRRFALDIFLGFRNYLKANETRSLGDLGIFARNLLNKINLVDLNSREDFLRTLEDNFTEITEYF